MRVCNGVVVCCTLYVVNSLLGIEVTTLHLLHDNSAESKQE